MQLKYSTSFLPYICNLCYYIKVCNVNNDLELDADAANETLAVNEAPDANKCVYVSTLYLQLYTV